jgi:hypothetical protein
VSFPEIILYRTRAILAAVLCTLAANDAAGSCGAAFCVVNTDWSTQGVLADSGVRFDLRFETIDLDQPRHGRDRVAVGAIPAHHDEVETRNDNWIATVDWSFAPRWAATLTLPYVDREHFHIHNHRGEPLAERWSFDGLGDARLQARRVFGGDSADGMSLIAWGVTAGVKLPTGKHDVTNAEGAVAERTMQPGTGTTDALLGLFWHGAAPVAGWSWFARAQALLPMGSRDGFKPGRSLQLDAGARYAVGTSLGVMLQLNATHKDRDRGVNSEPADSGQRAAFVSPGLSWNAGRDAQLYAFVQLPLYQSVNGVQLTAAWSALAGLSMRF